MQEICKVLRIDWQDFNLSRLPDIVPIQTLILHMRYYRYGLPESPTPPALDAWCLTFLQSRDRCPLTSEPEIDSGPTPLHTRPDHLGRPLTLARYLRAPFQ